MNVNDKSRATAQRNRIPGLHMDTFHIFTKFEFIFKFKFDQTDIMKASYLKYFFLMFVPFCIWRFKIHDICYIFTIINSCFHFNSFLNRVFISTRSKVISDLVYCAKLREITLDLVFALYLGNDCFFTCEFWHMPSSSCKPSFPIIKKGQKSVYYNLELTEHKNDLVANNSTPLIRPWQGEASSLTG